MCSMVMLTRFGHHLNQQHVTITFAFWSNPFQANKRTNLLNLSELGFEGTLFIPLTHGLFMSKITSSHPVLLALQSWRNAAAGTKHTTVPNFSSGSFSYDMVNSFKNVNINTKCSPIANFFLIYNNSNAKHRSQVLKPLFVP